MAIYREILSTIIANTGGDVANSETLVLLPDPDTGHVDDQGRPAHSTLDFPGEMLPEGAETRFLPADINFIPEAVEAARQTRASHLFIVPPLIAERFLPREWRQQHSPLSVPEVLVEALFDPERGELQNLRSCILIQPQYFTHSVRLGRWRSSFFLTHAALIVEHPTPQSPDPDLPHSQHIALTTVVLQQTEGPIRFFKLGDDALRDPATAITNDLAQLLRREGGTTDFGYVYRGHLEERYPCSYDFYSEETERLRQQVGAMGEKVALGEVADVIMGFRSMVPNREPTDNAQCDFEYIDGRNITEDGRVDLADMRTRAEPAEHVTYLREGDWCIREMFRQDPSRGFVVGVFEGEGQRIGFGRRVIVVRPNPSLSPAQRAVLFSFLRSPLAAKLSNAKGMAARMADHVRVSPGMLREYPVPLADEELTTALEHLTEAREAFRQWESDCAEAEASIWLRSDAEESRRGILQAGRLARQRYRAGRQTERLDFRIRTQFPHPLAYLWREMEVASTNPYFTFRHALKAAEGYACFLALTGIVMARFAGLEVRYLQTLAGRLNERASGTNFGDWLSILIELNQGRDFRTMDSSVPFFEVSQLLANEHAESALRDLKNLRDAEAHGRITAERVGDGEVRSAISKLETLYSEAEFLTDYSLIYLTATRYDSLRGVTTYDYRDLSGDNPLAPLRTGQAERSDLEAKSLYWVDRTGELHLLRPFLHYLECPECHSMSTFFLDTYSGDGPDVGLKSLERGSHRVEPIAEQLRLVGFLP